MFPMVTPLGRAAGALSIVGTEAVLVDPLSEAGHEMDGR
jgi:hypothetical protein